MRRRTLRGWRTGENWTAGGLARHFGHCHRGETYMNKLEVTLLDSCQEEKDLKKLEDRWICNLGSFFNNGLNSRNEVFNNRRRNFGAS